MIPTVVMLSWEYPPCQVGGLSRHVHALARALVRQGSNVHVLTRHAPGLPEQATEEGVMVSRVRPYFHEPPDFCLWASHLNFALLEAGVRLLDGLSGPVVLHAHDWLVAHAARGLKSLFQLPLVVTIHATEHGRNRGIHDRSQQYINDVEWWLTYEAWQVILCSQAMRQEVRQLFHLGDDKLAVIPNGVDLPSDRADRRVAPALLRERFAAPGERLLFHIGRLVPEKGAAVLLEAMPLLLRRHPVRLVIAGTGPFQAELERRAAALGVADRVHFTGWVADETAAALYHHADVAVVPSLYEPFGIVALEAMALGTPLVASGVGGLNEIVRHGENGLKAVAGSPLSLAEQIDRLLLDRPLARRLAAGARHEVKTRYSWESIAAQTADLYADVASQAIATGWAPAGLHRVMPPLSGPMPGRYTM